MNRNLPIFFLLTVSLFASGCSSTPVFIPESQTSATAPDPDRPSYPVYARSCGFLLLGLVPIGTNERFINAYQKLISQRSGTLSQVTLQESWYWGLIGTGYCATFTGLVTP
ncbi:hypothetical protein CH379_012810 [Leptospira ellisii]|uniref:Lipoprotein n=1 Tax=Leptospira ellisii TaxID=2023197 RepID=A0A2N0BDD4_9LEPT|nr:hypothetical protein [Leptospira ellisii]MDV6236508.1 hypothetical protein [Leptospira ellisii]PJZ94547.1 hypothetical protein CH379_02005 [Leptospira ellisii]PKA05807.1 hypothetical protein CH375_03095 [Leptospira ellisii]